jgi:hypothetical protein
MNLRRYCCDFSRSIGLPSCFDCGRVLDVPPPERREPPDPPWVVAQLAKVEAGLCEQGKGYWL